MISESIDDGAIGEVAVTFERVAEAFRAFGAAALLTTGEMANAFVLFGFYLQRCERQSRLRRQAIAKARGRNWRAVR